MANWFLILPFLLTIGIADDVSQSDVPQSERVKAARAEAEDWLWKQRDELGFWPEGSAANAIMGVGSHVASANGGVKGTFLATNSTELGFHLK